MVFSWVKNNISKSIAKKFFLTTTNIIFNQNTLSGIRTQFIGCLTETLKYAKSLEIRTTFMTLYDTSKKL